MVDKENSNPSESSIRESFSKHAKSYDKHAQLQKSMAERLASMLPERLPRSVTEVGCGTGLFTRHLLTHSIANLVLNDIAPGMVEFLKESIALPKNTRLVIGNAEKIKFNREINGTLN